MQVMSHRQFVLMSCQAAVGEWVSVADLCCRNTCAVALIKKAAHELHQLGSVALVTTADDTFVGIAVEGVAPPAGTSHRASASHQEPPCPPARPV